MFFRRERVQSPTFEQRIDKLRAAGFTVAATYRGNDEAAIAVGEKVLGTSGPEETKKIIASML